METGRLTIFPPPGKWFDFAPTQIQLDAGQEISDHRNIIRGGDMSQALDVIRVFYDVGCQRTSLPVWMSRMCDAISCAISGGLEFDKTDFITIINWRNSRWIGENTFEHFYMLATGMRHRDDVRNQGAIEALELYLGRPVYNYEGGRLYEGRSLYLPADLPSTHKLGWDNRWWVVSSYRDGAEPYINMMCQGDGEMKGKRCRLTPADVRAMEKARKASCDAKRTVRDAESETTE